MVIKDKVEPSHASGNRILVVDDNPLNVLLVRMLLAADYELADAPSLAQARSVRERFAPDLVLLDIRLPDGDGLAYARELAASANPPRLVILSAHAGPAVEAAAREAGAGGFITKPIDPQVFREAIARYLPPESDPRRFSNRRKPGQR